MNIRPSILTLALLSAGCASSVNGAPVSEPVPPVAPPIPALAAPAPLAAPAAPASVPASAAQAPANTTKLFPGNDRLFKSDIAPKVDPVLASGDKVSLNFEDVTVGNLATALLGDLLKLNYTVDAGGDTVVSLRTRQPLPRSQVLDVLDAVLLPHDLAIVRDGAGVYHVTKRTVTVGARPVVGASKIKDLAGAGTVIVPLNYIAAAEMAKILQPLAPREAIVYVDSNRNLLVLQGSKAQLNGWLEMVDAFDVDFLAGMSLGVFVLENANVNVVRDALQSILGGSSAGKADPYGGATPTPMTGSAAQGGGSAAQAAAAAAATSGAPAGAGVSPLSGLVRVFPIERLNALVVVTPRKHLLTQVETWIRRLDRPTDALEQRLYVYPVQNGSAVHLAEMLNGLFSGGNASSAAGSAGVAQGAAPTQFGGTGASASPFGNSSMAGASTGTAGTVGSVTGTSGTSTLGSGLAGGSAGRTGAATGAPLTTTTQLEGNVRVVADDKRNALLIRAPQAEYRRIEQALRELDKAPTQVLIEASIIEVSLTGNLQYGVEWFLQNSMSRGRTGQAALNMNQTGDIGAKQPGFSYTILNSANAVRATLNALAANTKVKVLSNPSIMVLDNSSATIMVGTQQPIQQASVLNTTSSVITNSYAYKDTGVILSVTPSINAGGLVTLDISQQVVAVGAQDTKATGQYSFLNRQIQTKVAVRSGEPVVLGGVISENQTTDNSGVPGLRSIPLLGALFSTNNNSSDRTELMVVMTPRVLENDDDLRQASAEMRQRMKTLSLETALQPAAPVQRQPAEGPAAEQLQQR
ncbi:MAG: type II secretion system secretin GspD [Acidovorax sp.]